MLENEAIQEVAKAHDATPAQVALSWLLAQGALPIPKAVNKAHIDENVASVDIELTKEELEQLDEEASK